MLIEDFRFKQIKRIENSGQKIVTTKRRLDKLRQFGTEDE